MLDPQTMSSTQNDISEPIKYVRVKFSPDEAESQRAFLIVMNNIGVITISRDDINECYDDFVKRHMEAENNIVLRGNEQVNKFKYAMKYFFKDKEYEEVRSL